MEGAADLERFVVAQDPLYTRVVAELRAGRKQSHWMWFIFPQIAGLGSSETARKYAIASRDEAASFLQHPILGARLRECTHLVNLVEGRSAHAIFGSPDDRKFFSSMTLFTNATADNQIFKAALNKYFDGAHDQLTLQRI